MKNKNNINWIKHKESISIGIAYRYNGSITVLFTTLFEATPDIKRVQLTNPIVIPIRKTDGVFEFGIHNREEREISTAVPFFRFDGEAIKNNKNFTKINITKSEEREILKYNS